jgi:hypothetical protein
MPLSAMLSGPLVCWLFGGVGNSDCRSVPPGAAVAVPADVVVAAALLLEVALVAASLVF